MRSRQQGLDSSDNEAHAVLCTPNQTYQIRQVQSSNSIFVLRPTTPKPCDTDLPNLFGLRAVSQCTSTFELVPSNLSAHVMLEKVLPVFDLTKQQDRDFSQDESIDKHQGSSKSGVRLNLPCSNEEFEAAWRSLRAFEWHNLSWKPTYSTLLAIWRSVLTAATLKNLDLDLDFEFPSLVDIVEEDGFPVSLLQAVMDALSQPGDHRKSSRLSYLLLDLLTLCKHSLWIKMFA